MDIVHKKEETLFLYSPNFHRKFENSLLYDRVKFHLGGFINESNGVPLLPSLRN